MQEKRNTEKKNPIRTIHLFMWPKFFALTMAFSLVRTPNSLYVHHPFHATQKQNHISSEPPSQKTEWLNKSKRAIARASTSTSSSASVIATYSHYAARAMYSKRME